MHNVLVRLTDLLQEEYIKKPWYTAVRAVTVDHGPLD
jgi:hypothetical protein